MTQPFSSNQFFAVVPAAGVGRRMASDLPKQYLQLLGKTVLEHTLATLLAQTELQRIVLVVAETDQHWQSIALLDNPRIDIVEGGAERSDSVLSGLRHLASSCADSDWILVHDVARACIAAHEIKNLISALAQDAVGGILAIPVSDTIKQVEQQIITATMDRSLLWQAQTPQMFRYALLKDALIAATAQGVVVTDEASAVELAGFKPRIVEGSPSNIKITRPEDLSLAAYYLQRANTIQQKENISCE